MNTVPRTDTLPRTIEPGLTWTGGCLEFEYEGEPIHQHMCSFLIEGDDKTLLVDTGHPAHSAQVDETLTRVLGDRPLDYVFPTHTEFPHAGNLPRLMDRYPNLTAVGNIGDYKLFYPKWYERGRFLGRSIGESIVLGPGHEFVFIEGIWRDLPNTLWGYDTRSQTLFVADGFAYTHHHNLGECALTSEERPAPPDIKQTVFINERALFWTRYVGVEKTFEHIDQMLEKYPTKRIAPAHGGVITNLEDMVPRLKEGMISMKRDADTRQVGGY
jgi:flavorubredoxin